MKKISAYQITATVEGKTWLNKRTTLTAIKETEAKEKAIKALNLSSEHILNIEPVEVFSTDAKLQTNNYPYGRLRCTAFFSVEYNGNKGARTTFQTINPKNGRLNNPKHSTYYKVILPMQLSNGHFDYCGYLDFNGSESINKGLYFMADFHELFTIEQIKNIALDIIVMQKVNAKAMCIYGGADWEQVRPLIEQSLKTLVKIANTGENLFLDCLIDIKAMGETKKPDYNPFKATSYSI